MKRTYVEFMLPGSFFPESNVKEVSSRNMPYDIPKTCYGYRFYDVEEVTTSSGEVLRGEKKNMSGMTYFGQKLSLEEVTYLPNTKILQDNMRMNKWSHVVKTFLGNYQPLQEGDVVISHF